MFSFIIIRNLLDQISFDHKYRGQEELVVLANDKKITCNPHSKWNIQLQDLKKPNNIWVGGYLRYQRNLSPILSTCKQRNQANTSFKIYQKQKVYWDFFFLSKKKYWDFSMLVLSIIQYFFSVIWRWFWVLCDRFWKIKWVK